MSSVHILDVENAKHLSLNAKQNIINWLTHDKYKEYYDELTGLIDSKSWQKLEDNFFRVIPFGTGGRRGTVGIGSNRINKVTVGEVTQALCTYLKQVDEEAEKKGIVIAYDPRNTSRMFTEFAAEVCAANNFKVYVYQEVRSTPQLSYSVRLLETAAGIVISASHNPSPDNGVKVYWSDGGQMVPPYDKELLAVADDIEVIHTKPYDQALRENLIVELTSAEDESYYNAVLQQTKNQNARSAVVAYSPLHGAGLSSVYPVLQKAGFDVRLYGPQSNYDGNFTNVTNHISNPEVPEASDKVSAFAVEESCDVVVTTDPDADRLGVVVVNKDKTTTLLNGNQTATLIAYHILETLKKAGGLSPKQFIGKTIVTTDMLQALADDYGVELKGNLLVGFKYIGELIKLYVDEGEKEFLFGGEESFGGLVGTYARDKDAASSALMIAELASVAKEEGKALTDVLDDLYKKHGYYNEVLDSTDYLGAEGFSQMKKIMNELRANPPSRLGEYEVLRVRDYITGHEVPERAEDVLRLEVSADGADRVTIRPSGTEPKVKIYVQTKTVHNNLQQAKRLGNIKTEELLAACKRYLK